LALACCSVTIEGCTPISPSKEPFTLNFPCLFGQGWKQPSGVMGHIAPRRCLQLFLHQHQRIDICSPVPSQPARSAVSMTVHSAGASAVKTRSAVPSLKSLEQTLSVTFSCKSFAVTDCGIKMHVSRRQR